MKFLKKQRMGFFVYVIVAIMAIVSLIVYVSNVSTAYYQDMNTTIVIMMICALAAILAALALPQAADGLAAGVISDVFRVAASVLIILSGIAFVSMRVESFGYIFGSNLELGNDAAFSAGTQAIAGIILFAATWLLSLAAAFLQTGVKEMKTY